jgi:hypothetical protein
MQAISGVQKMRILRVFNPIIIVEGAKLNANPVDNCGTHARR